MFVRLVFLFAASPGEMPVLSFTLANAGSLVTIARQHVIINISSVKQSLSHPSSGWYFSSLDFFLVSMVLRLALRVLYQSLSLWQEPILFHFFLGISGCLLLALMILRMEREPNIILRVVLKTNKEVTLAELLSMVLDELFNLSWV